MKMVLKIVIFGVLFFGTVFLDRKVLLPGKIMVPRSIFCVWLFCAYSGLALFRNSIKNSAEGHQSETVEMGRFPLFLLGRIPSGAYFGLPQGVIPVCPPP